MSHCSSFCGLSSRQCGSILILVLWIISFALILVAVLANNARLSATIVHHQQQALQHWADTLSLISMVKQEILFKQSNPARIFMSALQGKQINNKPKAYEFNGQKLKLSYYPDDDMIVRVYDLSGKFNIASIKKSKFRQLLRKKIRQLHKFEDGTLDTLMDAWQDWTDADNMKRLNGAEKNYYSKLEPPYAPRNDKIQYVNELHLIKGFKQVFGHYDFSQIFSLYGNSRSQVNPNIANRETLLLVPGVDEALADNIIRARQKKPFRNISEFRNFIPANRNINVKEWFAMSRSRYYALVIYSKNAEEQAKVNERGERELYVYKEIIQIKNDQRIRTLRVFPSHRMVISAVDR